MKLLDQYLEVRKAVVEVVSDLSNLRDHEEVELSTRMRFRDSVAKLFYMHYDFLPKPVLDALTLLQVSLDHPGEGPYLVSDQTVLPMPESQIPSFIAACSIFRNAGFTAALALKSVNPVVRQNTVIKLHARSVLYTMNQFATIDNLLQLEKRLRKAAQT